MGAPSDKIHLEQGEPAALCKGAIPRDNLTRAGLGTVDYPDDPAAGVLDEIAPQRSLRRGGPAEGDAEIALLDLALIFGITAGLSELLTRYVEPLGKKGEAFFARIISKS